MAEMDLLEGIFSRRSIRNYTGGKIPAEHITEIIRAGMYAPSARNRRPWHFIVIDDKSIFARVMKIHPYSAMLSGASHAVLVCGDTLLENGPGYYRLDCSAATQNILLASHAMGYGAVWLGVEPREERIMAFRELFNLPLHIQPLALVSIGIPSSNSENLPDRFEPEKIRLNKW